MALGPGRYDTECMALIRALDAQGVILCVAGGSKGHGFSAAFRDVRLMETMPGMLRNLADAIEKDGIEAGIRSAGGNLVSDAMEAEIRQRLKAESEAGKAS